MAKNDDKSRAGTSSEQAGAATRGSEAGSASEVTATGAAAGVSASGAESNYGLSGSETQADTGQAEAQTRENVRASQLGGDLDAFHRAHQQRILKNAESYDKLIDSINVTTRENTVKQGRNEDSIDLKNLIAGLAAVGCGLTVVKK